VPAYSQAAPDFGILDPRFPKTAIDRSERLEKRLVIVSGCLRLDNPAPRPRLDHVRAMPSEPSREPERITAHGYINLNRPEHSLLLSEAWIPRRRCAGRLRVLLTTLRG
jgi:hypothetical protein